MSSKSSEQKQVEAFKKAARELGCVEDEDAFDKALRKIASERPAKAAEKRKAPSQRKRK
jgi:hypothetical protein